MGQRTSIEWTEVTWNPTTGWLPDDGEAVLLEALLRLHVPW